MRLPELQVETASYELDAFGATVDQLRATLRALRAEGRENKAPGAIPSLGKMLKPELQALCTEKEVPFNRKTTAPELRQYLKGWRVEGAISGRGSAAAPAPAIGGSDRAWFGKREMKTYEDVLDTDQGYCQRAVLELDRGRASALLARFARRVKACAAQPLPETKCKANPEDACKRRPSFTSKP